MVSSRLAMAKTSISSIYVNPLRGSKLGCTPYVAHLNCWQASLWQRVSRSQIIGLNRWSVTS